MLSIRIEAALDPASAQAAVDHWLRSLDGGPAAVLIEAALAAPRLPATVEAVRLSPGCPCCTGSTVLRVALVRVAQRLKPAHALLLLARADHALRLQAQIRSGELGAGLRLI